MVGGAGRAIDALDKVVARRSKKLLPQTYLIVNGDRIELQSGDIQDSSTCSIFEEHESGKDSPHFERQGGFDQGGKEENDIQSLNSRVGVHQKSLADKRSVGSAEKGEHRNGIFPVGRGQIQLKKSIRRGRYIPVEPINGRRLEEMSPHATTPCTSAAIFCQGYE